MIRRELTSEVVEFYQLFATSVDFRDSGRDFISDYVNNLTDFNGSEHRPGAEKRISDFFIFSRDDFSAGLPFNDSLCQPLFRTLYPVDPGFQLGCQVVELHVTTPIPFVLGQDVEIIRSVPYQVAFIDPKITSSTPEEEIVTKLIVTEFNGPIRRDIFNFSDVHARALDNASLVESFISLREGIFSEFFGSVFADELARILGLFVGTSVFDGDLSSPQNLPIWDEIPGDENGDETLFVLSQIHKIISAVYDQADDESNFPPGSQGNPNPIEGGIIVNGQDDFVVPVSTGETILDCPEPDFLTPSELLNCSISIEWNRGGETDGFVPASSLPGYNPLSPTLAQFLYNDPGLQRPICRINVSCPGDSQWYQRNVDLLASDDQIVLSTGDPDSSSGTLSISSQALMTRDEVAVVKASSNMIRVDASLVSGNEFPAGCPRWSVNGLPPVGIFTTGIDQPFMELDVSQGGLFRVTADCGGTPDQPAVGQTALDVVAVDVAVNYQYFRPTFGDPQHANTAYDEIIVGTNLIVNPSDTNPELGPNAGGTSKDAIWSQLTISLSGVPVGELYDGISLNNLTQELANQGGTVLASASTINNPFESDRRILTVIAMEYIDAPTEIDGNGNPIFRILEPMILPDPGSPDALSDGVIYDFLTNVSTRLKAIDGTIISTLSFDALDVKSVLHNNDLVNVARVINQEDDSSDESRELVGKVFVARIEFPFIHEGFEFSEDALTNGSASILDLAQQSGLFNANDDARINFTIQHAREIARNILDPDSQIFSEVTANPLRTPIYFFSDTSSCSQTEIDILRTRRESGDPTPTPNAIVCVVDAYVSQGIEILEEDMNTIGPQIENNFGNRYFEVESRFTSAETDPLLFRDQNDQGPPDRLTYGKLLDAFDTDLNDVLLIIQ